MNRKMLNSIIILLAVIIVGLNIWNYAKKKEVHIAQPEKTASTENIPGAKIVDLKIGSKAPELKLSDLNGKQVKLSDFKGKKVILNFWATWCPPCKAEIPHMEKFYEENKNQGVTILAVNLTSMDKGTDVIERFILDYNMTFPVLLDTTGMAGAKYQAFTIPTSYIIDTNGIIRQKMVGPMDQETMKKLTDAIH